MPDSTSEIQSGIIDNLGWLKDKVIEYGIALITAVAIIVIGFWLVKRIKKIMAKFFIKKDFDPSLETFLMSLTSIALRILVIITALSQLGIEMTSFVDLMDDNNISVQFIAPVPVYDYHIPKAMIELIREPSSHLTSVNYDS